MDLVEQLKAERVALAAHLETVDLLIERLGQIQAFASGGLALNGSNGSRRNGSKNGAAHAVANGRRAGSVRALFASVPEWSTTGALKALAPSLSAGSVYSLVTSMAKTGELQRRGELGSYEYRGAKRGARQG